MQTEMEEREQPIKRFSAYWNYNLGKLIKERCPADGYEMSLVGKDREIVISAVNQGIDFNLEAIFFADLRQHIKHGCARLDLTLVGASLSVLVRRLLEMEQDEEGNAMSLASSICQTLNIELV